MRISDWSSDVCSSDLTAALRGLISCWMNIAIFETLSLPLSSDRRVWFQIDEMDALGRIEGLTNALARLRKFGGCVALGFQSYAQLKQIYGEGDRKSTRMNSSH